MSDTPGQIKNKINRHGFSGGQETEEEHRRLGGNPDVDVAYQYLGFFMDDDEEWAKMGEVRICLPGCMNRAKSASMRLGIPRGPPFDRSAQGEVHTGSPGVRQGVPRCTALVSSLGAGADYMAHSGELQLQRSKFAHSWTAAARLIPRSGRARSHHQRHRRHYSEARDLRCRLLEGKGENVYICITVNVLLRHFSEPNVYAFILFR